MRFCALGVLCVFALPRNTNKKRATFAGGSLILGAVALNLSGL